MADISLRERLQPALLDRLRDDEAVLRVLRLTVATGRLPELGVGIDVLAEALRAQGCRPLAPAVEAAGRTQLEFGLPPGDPGVARLKALPLRLPSGRTVPLSQCAQLELRTTRNRAPESPERRLISMRRLRDAVFRDLSWLLNTASLETNEDLSRYPEVRRSVLNFGMIALTGRAATSINPQQAARGIAEAVRAFEPRLTRVVVTPEFIEGRMDQRTLSFKIDAELWGQPAPQRLLLRTRLDVDSGDMSVADAQGG